MPLFYLTTENTEGTEILFFCLCALCGESILILQRARHLPLRKGLTLHADMLEDESHLFGIDGGHMPDLAREFRKECAQQDGAQACSA